MTRTALTEHEPHPVCKGGLGAANSPLDQVGGAGPPPHVSARHLGTLARSRPHALGHPDAMASRPHGARHRRTRTVVVAPNVGVADFRDLLYSRWEGGRVTPS